MSARPQWQATSAGVSIIFLAESLQAILLKDLDASQLLSAPVNTSLKTLNRLPDLIDDRGCEDVPEEAEWTWLWPHNSCISFLHTHRYQRTDAISQIKSVTQLDCPVDTEPYLHNYELIYTDILNQVTHLYPLGCWSLRWYVTSAMPAIGEWQSSAELRSVLEKLLLNLPEGPERKKVHLCWHIRCYI